MTPINFGQLKLLPITLVVPVVSFVLVLGLLWIIHRTKPGLAMRAISKDIETTRLLGVRVDRIIALAFGLGSALAAASGIMWALRYPQINPYMGIFPGFKAFIAAVLGGIGSIQGAMIGGLLLGFIEIMTVAFMPSLSGYRDAFAFVVLVLVLLVRPTGLFRAAFREEKDMKTSMRNLLLNLAAIGLLALFLVWAETNLDGYKVQILNLIAVNAILALSLNLI